MKRFLQMICSLLLCWCCTAAMAQDVKQARRYVREGNRLFRADKRQEAQVAYHKALSADSTNARARYNLATSKFPLNWHDTKEDMIPAMDSIFIQAIGQETNPLRRAKAYHNQGVLHQNAKQFQQAIECYKNALRNNPKDDESRYNLVLCQRQLKDEENNNQNQDQNQQDDQGKQDKQQQDKQQQQQQDKPDEQQQQQQPPMSKENAEQLLNAAMQQEKKTQQRMQDAQRQPSQQRRNEKNW